MRHGFAAGSIAVVCGDSASSRDFAALRHTRLPLLTLDPHGHDVPPDGQWGLLDPECGPQAGWIFSALAEMDIRSKWAEGAVWGGNALLSVDCGSAQEIHKVQELLTNTGAFGVGISSTQHSNVDSGSSATA